MTCIAYRDGTLAADSLATAIHGYTTGHIRKIFELREGVLAGICGYAPHAFELLRWYEKGRPGAQPAAADPEHTGTLVVFRHEGANPLIFEGGYGQEEGFAPYWAYGSGAEIALGAMYREATAEQAVEAAIALHTACGGPIRVLRHKA